MINDITRYFQNEITNVRKTSYEKGMKDAQNKMNNVVYNPKSRTQTYNDLDEI